MVTSTITPYSKLFHPSRDQNTVVAWRNHQQLTLADLRKKTAQISTQVKNSTSKNWAICVEDSFLFAASLLAVLANNKTPIVLGHTREKLLAEQINHYDAILTDLDLTLDCLCYRVDKDNQSIDFSLEEINDLFFSEDAQLILFTSGSTSKPKAISKKIHLLEKESLLLANKFGTKFQNKAIISTVSHLHLYGITFKIFLPLVLGIPFDANKISFQEELPLTHQDYVLITSPAFLKRLDTNLPSSAFVEIFSAGGILSFEHAQSAKTTLEKIPVEIYGSSETGVVAYRQQETNTTAFQAFEQILVSADSHGLIQISSPLFEDSQRPELNDIIEITHDGFLLKGRVGKTIKIEEKRISIEEIEARLMVKQEIVQASVIPLEENNRTILAAIIILSATAKIENEQLFFNQLKYGLKDWLEPVAIPKRWRIVKELPQNSQGKHSYYDLRGLFQ